MNWKKRSLAVLSALFLWLPLCAPAAEKPQVRALDPYTAMLVQFIGGALVDVKSYTAWDAKDQLKLDVKLLLEDESADPPLFVMNGAQYAQFVKDYRREGRRSQWLSASPGVAKRGNLFFLYEDSEVTVGDVCRFFGEPANLPFTVQKIMVLLSGLYPEKYGYFQRRLGEFDARLRSTLLSGRKLLAGRSVLDFGGVYGGFLKASGCRLSQPTAEETDRFLNLAGAKDPKLAKKLRDEIWKDLRIYVMDQYTDPRIKAALADKPGAFYISPPRGNDDPLFFLHHLMLVLGSAPGPKVK